jgi:exonuclease SbcC
MLLEHLRIQAFRGIRNHIEIPLDAPITILLAANGTAKTSVCDAVEWLLTGRVRRLQPGLISVQSLQNRYSNETPIKVQAMVNWTGMTREIERTEAESVQIPNARGGNRKPTANGKLLEQLTPEYVGQTSRSRNVEEPRAEWLRAVRFFSPDGLSLLLDDGDEAERVRGIAFAQLLGVGPVGRQIEGLKGVRAQIDSPRTAIANVVEKIMALENRLKAAQASVAGPYLTRVDSLLREVAASCKLTLPETLTTRREVLLSLRDRLASFERALDSQRAAYAKVRASFPEYQTAWNVWKKWSEEQKPAFEKAIFEAQKQRDDANRQLRALTTGAAELASKLGQVNTLLGQTQTAIAKVRLDASSQDSSGNLRVARVRADRDEATKNAQKAHAHFEILKSFADEFPARQRAFLELELLEKKRLELSQSIPSAEDQEGVERRVGETKLALTQLRQEISASTDRWQRWGAEVRAQAPNWTSMSACPLCGHDHESPEQLRAAIANVLSRQPSGNPETANRLAQLESAKAELESSSATIAERRRQLLALEQKIVSQKNADYIMFLILAQECGLDEHIFARDDALEVVTNRRRSAEETAAAAHRLASQVQARADQVSRWHTQLQNAADDLHGGLPIQPSAPESLPPDPSLDQRLQNMEELLAFAQAHAMTLREQAERSIRTVEEMRTTLPALEATLRQAQEALQPFARSADDARTLMGSIEESWQAVSTDPLDSATLARIADSRTPDIGISISCILAGF